MRHNGLFFSVTTFKGDFPRFEHVLLILMIGYRHWSHGFQQVFTTWFFTLSSETLLLICVLALYCNLTFCQIKKIMDTWLIYCCNYGARFANYASFLEYVVNGSNYHIIIILYNSYWIVSCYFALCLEW